MLKTPIRTRRNEVKMLETIGKLFTVQLWKPQSPFATLINTILSQNTNDRNSDAAMKKLRGKYKVTPRVLAKLKAHDLIPYIRSAGLYTSKAPNIIETSKIIMKQYGGQLTPILDLPYAEAKEKLMELPGVGPKTADILMAFVAKHPVIPVDTHVARVTKRLGIAAKNADYEKVRHSLEALIQPTRRVRLHLSVIEFGRKICKAPRPLCQSCPIHQLCPSSTV